MTLRRDQNYNEVFGFKMVLRIDQNYNKLSSSFFTCQTFVLNIVLFDRSKYTIHSHREFNPESKYSKSVSILNQTKLSMIRTAKSFLKF